MTRPEPKNNDAAAMTAETLLVHYSFDLSHWTAAELVDKWLEDYPARWLRLAIIEALYQGRYKSISVEQILVCWQRRSRPIYHFNLEFEQLICGKLPGAKIPEQDVKLTHQSAPFDDEELAENIEPIIQETDIFLTNNPALAPTAKYKPNLSQPTTGENVPIITEDSAEQSPAVALLSPPENSENYSENYGEKDEIASQDVDTNQENYLPLTSENTAAKADEKEKLSPEEMHRQLINDLLQEPWLDEEDEAAIQSILNVSINPSIINPSIDDSINEASGANGEIDTSMISSELATFDLETVLNLDSEQSPSATANSEFNWQENRPPIHQFTPDVAASEFYMKLKAVLENKLQHPEEEPRKRRYRPRKKSN
jgi:hypothetical protein